MVFKLSISSPWLLPNWEAKHERKRWCGFHTESTESELPLNFLTPSRSELAYMSISANHQSLSCLPLSLYSVMPPVCRLNVCIIYSWASFLLVYVMEKLNWTSWDEIFSFHFFMCSVWKYSVCERICYLHRTRAVFGWVHSSTIGYKLQHLLVTATWIWHVAQWEDLPQQDAEWP